MWAYLVAITVAITLKNQKINTSIKLSNMFQFFCYVMMIMCQITSTSAYTPVFQCVINREIDVENDSLLQRANVLASKIRFATTNVYWGYLRCILARSLIHLNPVMENIIMIMCGKIDDIKEMENFKKLHIFEASTIFLTFSFVVGCQRLKVHKCNFLCG